MPEGRHFPLWKCFPSSPTCPDELDPDSYTGPQTGITKSSHREGFQFQIKMLLFGRFWKVGTSLTAFSTETKSLLRKASEVMTIQNIVASAKNSKEKVCLLNDPAWGPTLLSVSELIHSTSFAFSYSKRHKWSASDFLLSSAYNAWK